MQRGDISNFTVQYQRNMVVCLKNYEKNMAFFVNVIHQNSLEDQIIYRSGICSHMLDKMLYLDHSINYENVFNLCCDRN